MALKRKEEADEPEEWMTSFADLMSLLMGFFVLLYSMSVMDEKKFFEMGKSVAKTFQRQESHEKVEEDEIQQLQQVQKQLRAFQLLIAVLNLGDIDEAIAKVEQFHSAKTTSDTLDRILKDANKKLKGSLRNDADGNESLEIIVETDNWFSGQEPNVHISRQASLIIHELATIIRQIPDFLHLKLELGDVRENNSTLLKQIRQWQASINRSRLIAELFIKSGVDSDQIAIAAGHQNIQPGQLRIEIRRSLAVSK